MHNKPTVWGSIQQKTKLQLLAFLLTVPAQLIYEYNLAYTYQNQSKMMMETASNVEWQ